MEKVKEMSKTPAQAMLIIVAIALVGYVVWGLVIGLGQVVTWILAIVPILPVATDEDN